MPALVSARTALLALACALALAACGTDAPAVKPAPTAVAPKMAKADVEPQELCQVKAELEDASSRLKLADLRTRLEKTAATDRAAQFGALLAIDNDQDRFHAFHDDSLKNPQSAVGPLGECFVYAAWKMSDQATGRCQMADERLRGAAIVDVARAELNRRKGAYDEAQTLVDNALSNDNGCAAALVEAARIAQAKNDPQKALASWERARKAWPSCYLCAVEAAKITEVSSGKDAAVPLWEAALALQPDAPEALKRYGAALAGKDDKKALAAYERAVGAGQHDVATFVAAAQLAMAAGDDDKALAYAEAAAKQQPNEIDAWRAILALAQKKHDAAKAVGAAQQVLRLVDEDLPALFVLGKDAQTSGDLVQAVQRYDVADRAVVAGRTGSLAPADLEQFKKDDAALLTSLHVLSTPPKGSASTVVNAVQHAVQGLFAERLKVLAQQKKPTQGSIEVSVSVSASGSVDEVEISKDTLADPPVTASVVANLRRALITGGAKRYSFQMDFQ
ncbi:MAG TPA: hypothetical protein VGO62_21390 [Myxococcota bacterium]|jgi:tetratricopeptide (TPR) repeat protein